MCVRTNVRTRVCGCMGASKLICPRLIPYTDSPCHNLQDASLKMLQRTILLCYIHISPLRMHRVTPYIESHN